MTKNDKTDVNRKYRCWISEDEQILSFRPVLGYEMKEFENYEQFQEYYYKKTYQGYKAQ